MEQTKKNGFPKYWVITKLGEVVKWGSGGTPSRKVKKYFTGNIPWIKTGELTHKYIYDSQEKISTEAVEETSAKIFPKDSVLIAMYGASIGKISILKTEASTNQACAVGNSNSDCLYNEFLYYYLLSQKHILIRKGQGGAQPNISQGIIKNHSFILPPLPEQHEIVRRIEAMLSELDHAIDNLKKARQQLKTYRQAVLKHAFEGKLTEKWREQQTDLEPAEKLLEKIKTERQRRYEEQLKEWEEAVKKWENEGRPGKKPQKPKEFKQLQNEEFSNLSYLPKEWNWISLGICIEEPKYGTSKKCTFEKKKKGVLRIPNLKEGEIDATNLKYADFSDFEITTYNLNEGDLLAIRSNGSVSLVGKTALIKKQDEHFLFAGYLIRIRPLNKIVNSNYLNYALKSTLLRNQIVEMAKSTSGVNNINAQELKRLQIPICKVKEQHKIVQEIEQRLSVADNMEKNIEDSLQKTEAMRQSILKKAFEGKLTEEWRQKHPELITGDNSAERLLERIKEEKEKIAKE